VQLRQARGVYGDLDRPPLPATSLARALARDGYDLRVVQRTASTNADVAAAARDGAPEGLVVVAEAQVAGRGRLDRSWVSPPRAGLTFSVLLRPPAPTGWLPLLGGLAVAVALQEHAGLPAGAEVGLKWPNDVLIDTRKVAGLLAEVVHTPATAARGDSVASVASVAVVLGIGLNVHTRADELPNDAATSLALAGARHPDRPIVLSAILRSLARAYASWQADPSALVASYRSVCTTIGREVAVHLPQDRVVRGTAESVDADGRLVVDGRRFGAGDVVHLR